MAHVFLVGGFLLFVAGVSLAFGAPAGLMTAGALLFAAGGLETRRGRG